MRWQDALLKYGEIAIQKGNKLEFVVNKRTDLRRWSIYLKDLKLTGEEDFIEED